LTEELTKLWREQLVTISCGELTDMQATLSDLASVLSEALDVLEDVSLWAKQVQDWTKIAGDETAVNVPSWPFVHADIVLARHRPAQPVYGVEEGKTV